MSRGGMVYVKRDLSHEEAPRTFDKEQSSVYSPWLKWIAAALAEPDAALPVLPPPPKGVSPKVLAAARRSFLNTLHQAGAVKIARHEEVIKAIAPALGWPWEGVEGSRYVSTPPDSWLLAGKESGFAPQSGWLEWAAAAVQLMKDPTIARSFLPVKTVVEPWQAGSAGGDWCYEILDQWWKCGSSMAPTKAMKAMSTRWEDLVASIDERLHCNPSPHGLPLHWQVSARQAQRCLLAPPAAALHSMDPMPPVHTQVRVGGVFKACWMGVAEWALLRFGDMVHTKNDWPEEEWGHFRKVIEEDVRARPDGTIALLLPFRAHLLAGVSKFKKFDEATRRHYPDTQKIAMYGAEIDAWWLSDLATARVAPLAPSRSRRL